ncbi:MAG: hypothetical protein ACPL7O_05775, partial [Armatimonadota bacterium]
PIPSAQPGYELVIRLHSLHSPMSAEVKFIYECVGETEAAAPAPKADAVLKAEEPTPQPDPPAMDNNPPEPGELVEIPKTKTEEKNPPKTKTKTTSAENWYTHPTGDYKFKLSNGWTVARKKFFNDEDEEYDTLWPPDKEAAIVCARDFTDNSNKNSDAVLKTFEARMLKSNPRAESTRIKLGSADAQQIATYDKEEAVMTWHLGIFYKGRSYYIAVSMPSKVMLKKMPDPQAWMLGSIVW